MNNLIFIRNILLRMTLPVWFTLMIIIVFLSLPVIFLTRLLFGMNLTQLNEISNGNNKLINLIMFLPQIIMDIIDYIVGLKFRK